MKRFQWCAVLAVVLLALNGLALAQASSSSVRGTVTDQSGSVLPGATVVIANNESKIARTVTTGEAGDYRFLSLPPGTYTLSVTANGFARSEQTGLQLLVDTPATANVQLRVGAANESVTVTSETPVLNLVDASLGNSFDQTQVRQVPLEGRNVPDLLSLQAGVAYTGNRPDIDKDQDTRNGSVNGARSDQSNVTLDGVDVNDQSHGYAFTSVLPVTLDSVQEFRVTTSNYNADQGIGSGAQVSLITKSGSNNFHGSVYEYHRNTITSANDYFVKAAEVRGGQPNVADKLLRNIFGASVGGPLKRDRLFFFLNYEGTRQREEESTVRSIPTPSLCQGNLRYADVNGGITTLTPSDIAKLDPLQGGYNMQGPGINLAVLNGSTGYWDKTFCNQKFGANDTSVGDGLNYSGFRFRAPVSLDNNAFIAKIDYHLTADGKHSLFWRGALQNMNNPQAPFLPGSNPEQTVTDHSKGMAVGYTAVLSSTMVNTFHWGFTRQSTGVLGDPTKQQHWNLFYGLDQGVVYSHNAQTPLHNLNDDFSWTKGRHTMQFGANLGFARDPRTSYEHSFSVGKGATNWMAPTGFANTVSFNPDGSILTSGSPLDPYYLGMCGSAQCFPEPASSPQYDLPLLGMLGMVSDLVRNTNYDKSGNNLGEGSSVKRRYGVNWYELYGQDSWRVKPNLTVTYGLRWSLFPPPWEVNGFQASPTCDPTQNPATGCPSWSFNAGSEFNQMVANMKQGQGYNSIPLLSFVLGGPANNGRGFYNFEKSDFSPRFSVAYSPRPAGGWMRKLLGDGDKTVVRGGFGKVYDRAGMQLLSTFDANAPGGLSSTVQNPCCYLTDPATFTTPYDTADGVPRITDINTIPKYTQAGVQIFFDPPPGQFPQTPGNTSQAITWGVDQSLKTPYAYTIDFSVARELPRKFSVQLAYVGRLGRNLLTQRDLRQPLDLFDPKSGVDYYAAATRLSQLARQGVAPNAITDGQVGATAQYWHDMIGPLLGSNYVVYFSNNGCQVSQTPYNPTCLDPNLIQAVYGLFTGTGAYPGNEVVGLGNIDLYYYLADDAGNYYSFNGKPGEMLNNQLTTQYGWSSIGKSNYNALQASLRKQAGHGLQFDLNYTYSRSIDITSSATRLGFSSSVNVGSPGTRLVNAFNPNGRRGVSDFDATHQINADWIAQLPFGKGQHFAGGAGTVLDAFIGGWQVSGLARWTSGFPFTVDNGNFWPTDWDEQGIAQMLARPKTGHFRQSDGSVSVFANPAGAFQNNFIHPFPGGSGSRNVIRGDGYTGLDMSLSKTWKMPREAQNLQFRWEVFNVPNLHRFNVLSGLGTQACACIASLQQVPQSFGDYTGLLTQPRVMQFALRYEF
jgi:Carboxypeptidase regulatory-like domain